MTNILEDFQATLPPTNTRVEGSTTRRVNDEIKAATERSVARYAGASQEAITRRIEELDREWDIERWLEMNAATLACTGAILALTVHRKFAWISAVVTGFLFQHALQGWCPPVPVLRRRGVRTAREIDQEKTALRILRGDFSATSDASSALRQVRGF
ncbi:MAG TPA: DUF2892 domain-containing protein [Chthoniobacterales bacterium]|nr:DUF2892 domain-containing protein [Chthoniobacterales bacterium]